jgi:molybdopterin-containing oxidoreductase family iron-sulfur binding subunit
MDSLSWDPLVPIERAYPYVVQPEQTVPGVASFFASKCNQCDAGCGIVARVREGRVVKLEGNLKEKALSRGSLCGKGQAGLQYNYSPDRYKTAQLNGTPIKWDKLVDEISTAISNSSKVAWVGRYRSGASGQVLLDFQSQLGNLEVVQWETEGNDYLYQAVKALYGINAIPEYTIDNATTIVTFGADFLASWGDTTLERGWALSRSNATKDGDLLPFNVSVGPRVGLTQSNGDLHLLTKPGSEVGLALAICAKIDLKNKTMKRRELHKFVMELVPNPDKLIAASGVKAELVEELIEHLNKSKAGHAVILPGGPNTGSNPTDLAVATLVLNDLLGNKEAGTLTFDKKNAFAGSSIRVSDMEVVQAESDESPGKYNFSVSCTIPKRFATQDNTLVSELKALPGVTSVSAVGNFIFIEYRV